MKKESVTIKKEKNILPGVIIAALLVSIIVYAVMIHAEKNALSDYAKGTVYVAQKKIPKGQLVSQNNAGDYLAAKEVDLKLIPGTAITSLENITEFVSAYDIEEGTFLTTGMFLPVNEVIGGMKEPVIAGFKADDLYQVVGGVLRSGDRIHIYRVEDGKTETQSLSEETPVVLENSPEAALVWENIFVQEVFDQTGASIGSDDRETPAQRVNVYMEKADIEEFYANLSSGTLRAVKVCN